MSIFKSIMNYNITLITENKKLRFRSLLELVEKRREDYLLAFTMFFWFSVIFIIGVLISGFLYIALLPSLIALYAVSYIVSRDVKLVKKILKEEKEKEYYERAKRQKEYWENLKEKNKKLSDIENAINILGLKSNYTKSDLKSAYRSKSKTMHPDAGGSEKEFIKLQEAFEILSNKNKLESEFYQYD